MAFLTIISHSNSISVGISSDQGFQTARIPLMTDETELVPTIAHLFPDALTEAQLEAVVIAGDFPPYISPTRLQHELQTLFEVPTCILNDILFESVLEEAHLTGFSAMPRTLRGPKLELCYAAGLAAEELKIPLNTSRFVVTYLGDAISTAAVAGGRIIDMSAWYDEGPFGVRSSGGLPFAALLELCASAPSRQDALQEVTEKSGLQGYLGVDSISQAEELALQKHEADLIYSAFVYQLAKEIGAYRAVLQGKLDALVLTGPSLPVNGLKGLSAYFGSSVLLLYPGDLSLRAAVHFGRELINSRKGNHHGLCQTP